MEIVYVDLDGVIADFDKGRTEHPSEMFLHILADQINFLVV